jgi:hypothetical protein
MEPGTNRVWVWGAVPALFTVTERKYNKYQKTELFQLRYEPKNLSNKSKKKKIVLKNAVLYC